MTGRSKKPVSKVGSYVREAKPSAPLPPLRRVELGRFFNEAPMCPCGSRDGLRFVTEQRTEQDEEGGWRAVTTAAWRCAGCRQARLPW